MTTIRAGVLLATAGLFLSACESPVALDDRLPEAGGSGVAGTGSGGSTGDVSGNPYAGSSLYVDGDHPAYATAASWRADRPADAELLEGIARTAQAVWLTGGASDTDRVRSISAAAASRGSVPVFVVYNIPARDCGGHSGNGGAGTASGYRSWIADIAAGLAGRPSIVVLEPDALALMDCLSGSAQDERLSLIAGAVRVLEAAAAAVYLDGGHARWHGVEEMARRLTRAGVAESHGFALNVSNFVGTSDNVAYGDALSAALGGRGYVIDTSRNGAGPASDGEWCNPTGRALGARPTLSPNRGRAHAFLWIKRPGESDGACNGGPSAGAWWPDYALGLARRAA